MKYCTACGKELDDEDLFCSKCGTKQENNLDVSTLKTNDSNYNDNIDLNMIKIPDTDFSMLDTPVTQQLYEKVTGVNPSYFDGINNPVEMVNFFDAVIFCNLLSIKNNKKPCYSIDGNTDVRNWPFKLGDREHFLNSIEADFDADGYRLPIFNEWVIAARGGQCLKHAGSNKLKEVAWYTSNSEEMTHSVKQKRENGFGLYDMNGNVWEWLWTPYGLACGGSWKDGKDSWDTSTCEDFNPNSSNNDVGFRIVSGRLYNKALNSYEAAPKKQDFESLTFENIDSACEEDTYENDWDNNELHTMNSNSPTSLDIKEEFLSIINDYRNQLYNDCYRFFSFKDIPEKNKNNMLKIAKNISFEEFVCMIDTSIMGSGKEGLIFTLSGIYEHWGPLSGGYYFSFREINNMRIEGEKDLCIIFNNDIDDGIFKNTNYLNISVYFFAEPLKELITKLIELNNAHGISSDYDFKSGKTKGFFNKQNRVAFYEGQLDGYKRCSREYEEKLRRQAELFLKVANKWRQERAEYEALLDEYDATIVELEGKLREAESPEYRERLNNVSEYREKLASLSY